MKRSIVMAMLLMALTVQVHAATNAMSRVARAQSDLANLEAMARESTNESDRAVWERRVTLAQKGVENARRLASLEVKAGALNHMVSTHDDTGQELRGLLREIEANVSNSTNAAGELDKKIRQLRDDRAALADAPQPQGEGDEVQQALAGRSQKLLTLDEELAAVMYRRDTVDYELRLKREAQRVEDLLREDALAATPSIASILSRRRALSETTKAVESFTLTLDRVQEQRDGVGERLAIERERSKYLDDEIVTLAELNSATKESIFSFKKSDPALAERQKRVAAMLAESRSEKEALGKRLINFENQVKALDTGLEALSRARRLVQSEQAYQDQRIVELTQRLVRKVTIPAAVAFSILLVQLILSRLILPLVLKRENLLMARRATAYFSLMLVTLVLAVSFLDDLKAIATMLGLVGAAIVIALQDLCSAFAGWFVIIGGRKVRVGDRVEIDGVRGDIVDIQILRTTMLELNNWLGVDEETGRVITIPNSFIFKSQVFNYTRMHPHIWGKVDITVTFETPFEESRALLLRILEEETKTEFDEARTAGEQAEERFGLPESHYQPKMYTTLADSGVLFTLVYVSHYKRFSRTRTRIGHRILAEFAKDTRMQLAYPTSREIQEHVPTASAK